MQIKCAILRHCYETAHVLIRGSVEVDLQACFTTPYVHVTKANRKYALRAYSFAFVCGKYQSPQWCFRQRDTSQVAREDTAGLWITLAENNIFPMLNELAQGKGKIVMRVFWSWPRLEQHPQEKRKAMLIQDALERRRDCEATTAAGSPVSGPGSPGFLAGSPDSAGSAGSASDGHVDGLYLGEPAICGPCERVKV